MIQGDYLPEFSSIIDAFRKILPKKKIGGAALCVYSQGKKVIDVWGGTKNKRGELWQADTLAFSASTTKGVTSTLLHTLIDKGVADYDDPVAKFWPEFGQNGKHMITIRQVLCHEAGLYDISPGGGDLNQLLDWPSALRMVEQAAPSHPPGLLNAYHALSYGHIVGGLIERLAGMPFQHYLHQALADPLDLDGLYIGVPKSELHRLAELTTLDGQLGLALLQYKKIPKPLRIASHYVLKSIGVDFNYLRLALIPDYADQLNFNDHAIMQTIGPAMNGAFTARSLAKMYAVIANQGAWEQQQLLSSETVRLMGKVQNRRRDKVLLLPMRWRLGYHQVFALGAKTSKAFGQFGFGGSGGWCDPSRNLAMALTLNSGVGTPLGDLRIMRMSRAVVQCVDKIAATKSSLTV